jgi:hypothetical protein
MGERRLPRSGKAIPNMTAERLRSACGSAHHTTYENRRVRHFRWFVSGSDGTRTRDLRRDRPIRVSRQAATRPDEHPYLLGLFTATFLDTAWLHGSLNKGLGHERATQCCLTRKRMRVQFSARHLATARHPSRRRRSATLPQLKGISRKRLNARGRTCSPSTFLDDTLRGWSDAMAEADCHDEPVPVHSAVRLVA